MKITGVLLLAVCLQVSARGVTQTVTISVKDVPLISVLKEIKKQTGYSFFADNKQLQKARNVSLTVNNLPLLQVLDLCFKDQPLTYTIIGNVINVIQKKEEARSSNLNLPDENLKVSGRVVNPNGEPVVGATVSLKDGSKSTTTNANGEFTLADIDKNSVLMITSVGYEPTLVPVKGQATIKLILPIKISSLDEMQVIAYGTTSKRFNTGNVASVKATDIEKQPVNNPLLALQGRVPGLVISQATGFAGSGVKVRIQGENSITNGNDPLYVVDGVPFVSQMMPSINVITGTSGGPLVNGGYATYGNPLNFINPLDIESIEVLKDADATAIYGSQAANGAILITTKKGKAGEQKIDFNLQQGWGKVTRQLDLLNRRQYLDMRYEALTNDGIALSSLDKTSNYDLTVWDTSRSTDWQKVLIGNTAHYTDLQATVSGGNTNTNYTIGSGYHRETVVIPGDFNDQKGSFHFQVTSTSANQKLKVQLIGNYMMDVNKLPNTASEDLTKCAIQYVPVAPPPYNPDGTLNWALNAAGNSTWDYPGNPMAQLLNKYKGKTSNLVGNVLLSYQFIPGLNLKTSLGYTNLQTNETVTLPLAAVMPQMRATTSNRGLYADNNLNTWIIEPQLNYEKKLFNGKLDALLGTTVQQRNSSAQKLIGTGYISDAVLDDIKAASSLTTQLNFQFIYKYTALFGRINYNWQNKYIVNITARRDGSSRFGENNQFHNFGSVGAAWIFSEAKIINSLFSFLSFGKMKVSYGTTGSDQIGDYQYLSTYSPVTAGNPYQGINTLRSNGLSNPYLQWEETRKLSVGLDLGFLKDRVLINTSYYQNRSSNQLLAYKLPITTGFQTITQNFPAIVQNTGLEVALTTVNVQSKKIRWSTSINFTLPRNKLVAFPNIESSSYANILIVGQSISIQKKLHYIGVDQNTGAYFFESKTNPFNPTIPDDANVVINTSPQIYGGFQNSVSYKGFQFDLLFQFTKQKGPNYFFGFLPGTSRINQPTYILDRWQMSGELATHQRFNSDYRLSTAFNNANYYSDASFADASYIRLKNVSLSYQLGGAWIRKMHLHAFKIYAHAQNLLTFTNYKGLDPETLSSTTLPPLRVLTVGVQITL